MTTRKYYNTRNRPVQGKHYDVEMDCATVADGKLDECIELPGKQIEMSGKLSIVRTDPFTESGKLSIVRTDPFMTRL
jgi:hypothetical protein